MKSSYNDGFMPHQNLFASSSVIVVCENSSVHDHPTAAAFLR